MTYTISSVTLRQPDEATFPFATLARWAAGNDWTLREVHRTEEDATRWRDVYMQAAPETAIVRRDQLRMAR